MIANTNVRRLGLLDHAAHLIEMSKEFSHERTKDIYVQYMELVTLIRGYDRIWKANIPEEVVDTNKFISSVIADLLNDLENLFGCQPDQITKDNIEYLKSFSNHFDTYQEVA